MQVDFVLPFVLGVVAVLQATLNREIAASTGLAAATALNMLVALLCAVAFAAWCATRGETTGATRWSFEPSAVKAWWLVPGVVGFAIVFGLPWSVQRIGALSTFVALVGAQMLTSALWDHFALDIRLSPPRIAGALCTIVGVVLLARTPAP